MVSPANQQNTREQLDELRVAFGKTIKHYFFVLFIITVLIALSLIGMMCVGFFNNKTMDAAVLGASLQVAFGMVIGFVCVYIGLMMTWIGINVAFTASGEVGGGAFALKSASPGLLFALGGMILVAVSLYKRIEYQENVSRYAGSVPFGAKDSGTQPTAPKHIEVTSPENKNP
ncbi:MAG: hypothetical protein L0211_21815 [Planctomycetaceae bacterium]|nr:hypothetical protein [Planctomycetaceae bacterium]